jgi:death-on-curing protein
MIEIDHVVEIHSILISKYGGLDGIRDKKLLDSAINRPFATFDGIELYDSIEEKAAAIVQSILTNHPFFDGNKRTGYVLMRLFLRLNGKDIIAAENEKYDFVISIAQGKMNIDQITKWIIEKVVLSTE